MQPPDRRVRLALLSIWFIPALWAVNYIIARKAPGVIEPYSLALGRWGLAGLLLAWFARAELWREHCVRLFPDANGLNVARAQ